MNRLLIASAALLLAAAPATAQDLRTSATTFCNAVRKINAQGMSAAPGTLAAEIIASKAAQSSSQYRQVWQLSKLLGIPACQRTW